MYMKLQLSMPASRYEYPHRPCLIKVIAYSNMDGTRDSHTEWSKSERERQMPYDITDIWNLI